MACMSVTLDTSHCDTSPLNELAPPTVAEVGMGARYGGESGNDAHTSQATAGVAHLHIWYMFVALDTFHAERSSLKSSH